MFILPLYGTKSNVELGDLDINFQDQSFSCQAFAIKKMRKDSGYPWQI